MTSLDLYIMWLDSLRWFSQRRSPTPHFWELRTHGAMTPKFELGGDLLYNAPTPKLHRPMFTRSEVIVLTNKQTPLKTSNALRYVTRLRKNGSYRRRLYINWNFDEHSKRFPEHIATSPV